MARNYAQIMTAIWRNAEFRALAEREQRTYLMLVTQPDISAAGVLALRLRRWSDMAADSTPDGLVYALKVLEAGRFIVVDWDAEELLVRSFIRWDGGFGNPKRRPVIIRSAAEVDSELIRRHLAVEFGRCGITALPGGPPDSPPPADSMPPDSPPNSLSGSPSKIENADRAADPFPQVNSLSDRHAPSDGVVVTYLSTEDPTTHNPQPTTPPATAGAPQSRRRRQAAAGEPEGFAEWYGVYPRHEARAKAVTAYRGALRKSGITTAVLLDGARRYALLVQADGREASKIAHPATWLNGERWNDETPAAQVRHLAVAPTALPGDPAEAFAELRRRAAAPEAARYLGISCLIEPQPPSDTRHPRQWEREQHLAWLDAHERQLVAAFTERSAG
jgi:hypothetical protein